MFCVALHCWMCLAFLRHCFFACFQWLNEADIQGFSLLKQEMRCFSIFSFVGVDCSSVFLQKSNKRTSEGWSFVFSEFSAHKLMLQTAVQCTTFRVRLPRLSSNSRFRIRHRRVGHNVVLSIWTTVNLCLQVKPIRTKPGLWTAPTSFSIQWKPCSPELWVFWPVSAKLVHDGHETGRLKDWKGQKSRSAFRRRVWNVFHATHR